MSAGFRPSTVEAGNHGNSERRLWRRLQPLGFYSGSGRQARIGQSRRQPVAAAPSFPVGVGPRPAGALGEGEAPRPRAGGGACGGGGWLCVRWRARWVWKDDLERGGKPSSEPGLSGRLGPGTCWKPPLAPGGVRTIVKFLPAPHPKALGQGRVNLSG